MSDALFITIHNNTITIIM